MDSNILKSYLKRVEEVQKPIDMSDISSTTIDRRRTTIKGEYSQDLEGQLLSEYDKRRTDENVDIAKIREVVAQIKTVRETKKEAEKTELMEELKQQLEETKTQMNQKLEKITAIVTEQKAEFQAKIDGKEKEVEELAEANQKMQNELAEKRKYRDSLSRAMEMIRNSVPTSLQENTTYKAVGKGRSKALDEEIELGKKISDNQKAQEVAKAEMDDLKVTYTKLDEQDSLLAMYPEIATLSSEIEEMKKAYVQINDILSEIDGREMSQEETDARDSRMKKLQEELEKEEKSEEPKETPEEEQARLAREADLKRREEIRTELRRQAEREKEENAVEEETSEETREEPIADKIEEPETVEEKKTEEAPIQPTPEKQEKPEKEEKKETEVKQEPSSEETKQTTQNTDKIQTQTVQRSQSDIPQTSINQVPTPSTNHSNYKVTNVKFEMKDGVIPCYTITLLDKKTGKTQIEVRDGYEYLKEMTAEQREKIASAGIDSTGKYYDAGLAEILGSIDKQCLKQYHELVRDKHQRTGISEDRMKVEYDFSKLNKKALEPEEKMALASLQKLAKASSKVEAKIASYTKKPSILDKIKGFFARLTTKQITQGNPEEKQPATNSEKEQKEKVDSLNIILSQEIIDKVQDERIKGLLIRRNVYLQEGNTMQTFYRTEGLGTKEIVEFAKILTELTKAQNENATKTSFRDDLKVTPTSENKPIKESSQEEPTYGLTAEQMKKLEEVFGEDEVCYWSPEKQIMMYEQYVGDSQNER